MRARILAGRFIANSCTVDDSYWTFLRFASLAMGRGKGRSEVATKDVPESQYHKKGGPSLARVDRDELRSNHGPRFPFTEVQGNGGELSGPKERCDRA